MRAEIELYGRAWRGEFHSFLKETKSELTVVCPYIREAEANFVTGELSGKIRIVTLTSLNVDGIINGALEIGGIERLAGFSPASKAVNLPRLHAKVFVSDSSRAIITSANLTSSGIDKNYEYGVSVKGIKPVSKICRDIENYGRIGTEVKEFRRIKDLADSAKNAYKKAERKTARETRELKKAINELRDEFLSIQIGERSETGLFSDALLYILGCGAANTKKIQDSVREMYPELCEDKRNRIIKNRSFGKLWKHHLRNAQQGLKKNGKIKYDKKSRLWSLI